MSQSRVNKAIRNSTTSLICQLVGILVSFASRTAFTYILGAEYLGISGLFTNILAILSFAELGFGSAIVYRLYSPLANGDYNKVRLYMRLYKKIYIIIAILILILGIAVIPFLDYLVDAPDVVEDVRVLYCLYLFYTVVSYICVYKKSLLIADQNDYIVAIISQIVTIVMHISQIIILVLTHNFILYCVLLSLFTLLDNILCSYVADRKYKYLEEPIEGRLTKDEISGLKKDIKGLALTKIAGTILSSTDNIFISYYIGISSVGILSNYSLILVTINGMMNRVFSSLTSVVGNLVVKEDPSHTELVLKRMYFLNAAIYCLVCTGILVLIEEFVTSIWLNNEYTLPHLVIILAVLELFFRSLHFPIHTVQMAFGLFSQYRFMYLIAAALNLILNFALVGPMGMAGLILATIFSRFIIFFTDIYVVYRFGFRKSPISYVMMIIKWLIFLFICILVSKFLISLVHLSGIVGFIARCIIVVTMYMIIFILVYHKNSNFIYYKNIVKSSILK